MNSNSKMSDDLKAKFIVLKKEIDKVDDTNSLITLKNQLSDLKMKLSLQDRLVKVLVIYLKMP